MKLNGRRESTNVDDRRGMSAAKMGGIGGIGGIIVIALVTLLWLLCFLAVTWVMCSTALSVTRNC